MSQRRAVTGEKAWWIVEEALDGLKVGNEAEADKKIDESDRIDPKADEEVLNDSEEDTEGRYA